MQDTEKKDKVQHSIFRKGITDYGDGANVTHHLGNDDYEEGTNLPDDNDLKDNPLLEGKEAGGNALMDDEDFASDKDKAEKDDLRT